MAAWIDGSLPESERREFERRIAADPDLRAQLEAIRALVGEQLPAAPVGVIVRAQAICPRQQPAPWLPLATAAGLVAGLLAGYAFAVAGPGSAMAARPVSAAADAITAIAAAEAGEPAIIVMPAVESLIAMDRGDAVDEETP